MLERWRYRSFRRISRLTRVLKTRFTPAGWVLLALLVGSAALGLDTDRSTAYQSFTFLAFLFSAAALSAALFRVRFEVERRLPRFGTAGEALRYHLAVENLGKKALAGLEVMESLVMPVPSFEEFRAGPEPEHADRLERFTGFSRWRGALAAKLPARAQLHPVPELPPGGSAEIEAELIPSRRGRLRLEGVIISRPDPVGLFKATSLVRAAESVLILPKRYPVPRLSLSGRRRYQQGGVALSSSVGDSQEFMSLREYRPGDPKRRIHWRSWAKTGKLIVKEYQDEYFVRHALVLDTFMEPGQEAVFEEAVSVAASFACTVLTQESLLDLLFIGREAYCFTSGRGLGGADRMLEILAGVRPCEGGAFDELAGAVSSRHELLSGCICVLLGCDEPRLELVRRLRATGVPVTPFVLTAGDPAVPGGFRRLRAGHVAEDLASVVGGAL